MPGGSSTAPGDTSKTESPVPLLGVAGQAGSMDQQDGIKDERHSAMNSAPLTAEGACQWEQYCILVRIETARDKKPLQAHARGEALLKDFFQATIGILYAIIIISPTEGMLFTPGRSKELGMSYEDSRAHCQQLNGIHSWVGSAVEVSTLQRMVKADMMWQEPSNTLMRGLKRGLPRCMPHLHLPQRSPPNPDTLYLNLLGVVG